MPKKSILVADDEPGYQDLFLYVLDPERFDVHTASDGLQALVLARRKDYDLIFLDTHLPKLLGTEVLRRIREMNPIQRVVLMTSADPEGNAEEVAMSLGAFATLCKPADLNSILQVMEKALGTSVV